MRLMGERWRTTVSTVRLGRDEYRVVRPAKPLRHAPLYEAYLGVEVCVDKQSAREFAMAWALAARSPRTIVYLPLRQNDCGCRFYPPTDEVPLLDLVLMHHSLGLKPSRWREIRQKLANGKPDTVECQGIPDTQLDAWNDKDRLRHDIVAQTVFITGSKTAFEAYGCELRQLVEECPQHMHEAPETHCCAEIEVGGDVKWLHVVYCDKHRIR